ncbi:MAG: biotin--[acetyl-CoA-carboxylase] ligase [Rhodospirillales bacterium]|nr:biotin--[acetyl-CoA-carboxylase] ligase [Rhodospirillales bacterium]
MRLSAAAGPSGIGPATGIALTWRLCWHDTLPSTSDACIEAAMRGEPAGLVILARAQTAARGSRGRSWTSIPGNLLLSVLLRPRRHAAEASRFALLAGVALAETLQAMLADPASVTLKWPNDLLLDGRKLAGILVDSAATPEGRIDWLVIGIGVNLVAAPEGTDTPAIALSTRMPLGGVPAVKTVADALLARLGAWLAIEAAQGFAPVRAAWMGRAAPPGTSIGFRHGTARITGRFAGIDAEGALLIEEEQGALRRFSSGEVLDPATPRTEG